MVRFRRKLPSRAERIERASPMALVPYIDKTALQGRLEKHVALMANLLAKGLDYTSLPKKVLASIVRDYQTAGLDVPTSALRAVSNTTPRMPAAKKRPAPIAFTPLPDTRSVPNAYDMGDSSRESLLRRGYNPKIGGPNVPPPMPYVGASRRMPYAPVNRYTVGASARAADSIAATNWLPPWMIEGDQPNQFVKTPRPMSMGRGPSFSYVTEQAARLPSPAVQAFNARARAGQSMPLPYTGRITMPGQRVFRGAGGGGAGVGGFASQVFADKGIMPIPVPNAPAGDIGIPPPIPPRPNKRSLQLPDLPAFPVPDVSAGDILPDGIKTAKRRRNVTFRAGGDSIRPIPRRSRMVGIPVPDVDAGDILPDGVTRVPLAPLKRRRRSDSDSMIGNQTYRRLINAQLNDPMRPLASVDAALQPDLAKNSPKTPGKRGYARREALNPPLTPADFGINAVDNRPYDDDDVVKPRKKKPAAAVPATPQASARGASDDGSPQGSPIALLNASDLEFLQGANIFQLGGAGATAREDKLSAIVMQSPEFKKATAEVSKKYAAALNKARANKDDDAMDLLTEQMEQEISDKFLTDVRSLYPSPRGKGQRSKKSTQLFSPSDVAKEKKAKGKGAKRTRSLKL